MNLLRMMRVSPLLALALLAACGDPNHEDLHQKMANAAQGTPPPIEPLPALKKLDEVVYQGGRLRDPFENLAERPAALSEPPAEAERAREALENFPLDALKMVGTLRKQGRVYALIKTPDNTLQHVTLGNHMGQNLGRIIEITEAAVELRELTQDGAGKWAETRATLPLQE